MRSAVLLAIFLIASPALMGQSRRAEFLNVKSWRGSFDMSINRADVIDGFKWSIVGKASGQLLYDAPDLGNTPPRWLGKVVSATVSVSANITYSRLDCTGTGVFSANGPLEPVRGTETEVRAMLNVWDVSLDRSQTKATYTEKYVCPNGYTSTKVLNPFHYLPVVGAYLQTPYPGQGYTLDVRGKAPVPNSIPIGLPREIQLLEWDVHFHLEPVVDELMLEVTSAQYDTWRPAAEPGPTAGKPLELTATVKRASGQDAQVEVDRFVWELTGTSSEPGIAMNFPWVSCCDYDPDMKLEPQSGQIAVGSDGQRVERSTPNSVRDRAMVLPYDWGGWSTLQVSAYLRDGRKLVGKLQGSSEDGVRLPKRTKDSLIADVWKKDTGASGADSDDNESDPTGEPGCNGDGLTLYEEYRGFYENGKHIEGKPDKKDFFILNQIGSGADGGLDLFTSLTGLVVHKDLLPTEFGEGTRVINDNYKKGPHRVDQHGVAMLSSDNVQGGLTSTDKAFERVHWRPGMVDKVEIENPNRDGASYNTSRQVNPVEAFNLYDKTVAHELLHTVGVDHHGYGDGSVWALFKGSDYTLNALGRPYFSIGFRPSLIFDEQTNEDLALSLDKAAAAQRDRIRWACTSLTNTEAQILDCIGEVIKLMLSPHFLQGVEHGEHSGNDQCVMRYHFAEIYQSKDAGNPLPAGAWDVYALVPPGTEPSGMELCDSLAGTGINAPGRKPQPRYKDAFRGSCKQWVCVNDAIPPRSSY